MFIQIWPNFGLKKRSFFGKIGFDLFWRKNFEISFTKHFASGKNFFDRIFSHFIQNCFPVVVIGMHLWHKSELLLNILSFLSIFLKNGPTQASFCLNSSFQQQFYRKIVDFSGIRTHIVRVEGTHAVHLTPPITIGPLSILLHNITKLVTPKLVCALHALVE